MLVSTFALLAPFAAAQAPRPLPPLADATRVWDTAAGAPLAWPELRDRLAKLDVVVLGETHIDDTTHRVELHVLNELLARRPGKVVLSLEMFERDVQPVLDDYLAGRCDEATFLVKARPWHNYATAYRPLVEAAKAAKIPVIAANFPGSLRRPLASGGKQAIDALKPEQRELLPAEIFPASEAYWQRVERAVRGHMGGAGSGTPEERLYDTQNLWDNAMGDNVAKARKAHRDSVVLHVAGGFHVAYRDGTVAQFARRSKDSKLAVVQVAPVPRAHDARPDRDREQADYLVYAEAHAREEHDGNHAVSVPAELRYRLEAPAGGAPRPLMLWLPDRMTRTDDAVTFWRTVLGDDAALAVVEAPFPEVQDDLATGGRYAFGDGFRADYARVATGLARIVESVTRNHGVDPRRVVVAGAGAGATAVVWTALYGDWLDADFVAIDPDGLARLAMEALPDQRPAARSLRLFARGNRAPLDELAKDFAKLGTKVEVSPLAAEPALLAQTGRAALGLPALATGGDPASLLLAEPTPRAREWAALHAARQLRGGVLAHIVDLQNRPHGDDAQRLRPLRVGGDGPWPVSAFANGKGLPLAGGPFGGTTVVVLPKGTSDADKTAWLEHEKNRVLKQRSMFANIAIASADGAPSLADVITQLKARGRLRFLIVPAVFCADAVTMQALRAQLGDAGDGADVAWLPGLGAALAAGDH